LSFLYHNEEPSQQTPKALKITWKDFENYVKTGNIRNGKKSFMNDYSMTKKLFSTLKVGE
jgi:hypothetical protein